MISVADRKQQSNTTMIGRAFILLAAACTAYGSVVKDKGVPFWPVKTDDNCVPGTFSCTDCQETSFCLSSGSQKITCDGVAPFCDKKTQTCGGNPDPDLCGQQDTTGFKCVRDGTFPDANDCSQIHICTSDISKNILVTCDKLEYDPDLQTCTTEKTCDPSKPRVDCTNQPIGRRIPITGSKIYYAVCLGNNQLVVDKCNDDETFNAVTSNCDKKQCPTVH